MPPPPQTPIPAGPGLQEKTCEPWILHDFGEGADFCGADIRLVVCAYIRPEVRRRPQSRGCTGGTRGRPRGVRCAAQGALCAGLSGAGARQRAAAPEVPRAQGLLTRARPSHAL